MGTYIFKVKTSNGDGYRNEKGASIKIIITPPWWKTRLFYTFLVIVIILIVYKFYKNKRKELKKR